MQVFVALRRSFKLTGHVNFLTRLNLAIVTAALVLYFKILLDAQLKITFKIVASYHPFPTVPFPDPQLVLA